MSCKDFILSNNYLDVITDYPLNRFDDEGLDACYINIDNLYNIVYVNRDDVNNLESYFFQYRSIPKLYGLMQTDTERISSPVQPSFDPASLVSSGILRVQQEPLALTGRGVIICFIDTGIDYTLPVFREELGNSRVLTIWDQTIQSGAPPEGFLYGTEYTREDLNEALRSPDPYIVVPSRDEIGHGTELAGVATGSRVDNKTAYLGAAPNADIAVVKLKQCKPYLRDFYLIPSNVPAYEESDLMLALKYADSLADRFRRPVVICIGVGTNYGDHEGSSAFSRYLNLVGGKRSRAVVVCGGNEGNADHHYQAEFNTRRRTDDFLPVEIRVGENEKGFIMELWGSAPDVFTVSIRSPGGETTPPVRLRLQDSITYGFVYEKTRITVIGSIVEPSSGAELILLRMEDPTPGIWTLQVEAIEDAANGDFHIWLPITAFLSASTYFLEATPDVTLTEPIFGDNVIGVSTYNAANNSFYLNSGRGFSRNDRVFPVLAAPGVEVSTVNGKRTGSGLAAAVTSGAVAQFMEWAIPRGNNDAISGREIRNYLIRGADRSAGYTYPNREWGYGRLDMVGTFDALTSV